MGLFDQVVLLITGLGAIYLIWRFVGRYGQDKGLYDVYYLIGFVVLLVSGLLLIFLGYDILASPWVLTVASLIPLGISLGISNQYYPAWKKAYAWFALIGFLAIAFTSVGGSSLKKFAVPLFHGVAGMLIFLGPIIATIKDRSSNGFYWVGIGGALIGIGGIALSFLSADSQLLFFSKEFVFTILAPLLLLMTAAFALGFNQEFRQGMPA
ncbi:MAG: hypothetical protein OEV06_11680 [Anaerolineae bacterium]|nr:hypothetical protein [Anaerolineae bacterium]